MKKRYLSLLSLFLLSSCGGSSSLPSSSEEPVEESPSFSEIVEKNDLLYGLSFDEEGGETTKELASGKDAHIDYVFNEANQSVLLKKASDPIRRDGVSGNSLYMDGFSTSVMDRDWESPISEITLSSWVAPRGFENVFEYDGLSPAKGHTRLTSVFSKGDMEMGEGFVFGYGRLGLWGLQLCLHNSWTGEDVMVGFYDPIHTLPLYEWSHISASFSGSTGRVSLSFNGKIAYETILEDLRDTTIIPSSYPLYFGRYANPMVEFGVDRQIPAGLIDEPRIYGTFHTPKEVEAEYLKGCPNGVHPALDFDNVKEDRDQYEGDRYRPIYHALPPATWMNEPHSPFYYKGKYHILYQHNPFGPYWSQIRWAHLVSDDMVHWVAVKDAVAPQKGVCPEGVWTGGVVIGPDEVPWLVLTAGTNKSTWSGQNIAFAHAKDPSDPYLTEWVVEDTVVLTQPAGDGQGERDQFRDPFVWKDGDTYYMLVSTSIPGRGGSANAYTSKNLKEWEYKGYVYECDYGLYPEQGAHWECVNLLPITNKAGTKTKWILFDCPQYTVDGYVVDCYYWIGDFDKVSFRFHPFDHKPKLFDFGRGIYTGQTGYCYLTEEDFAKGKTRYEEGRTILYSLAQGKAAGTKHNENSGWAHNMAIPYELYLNEEGNDVLREPIAELSSAEGEVLFEQSGSFDATALNSMLEGVRGDSVRIDMEFRLSPDNAETSSTFSVRYNPYIKDDKTEQTDINIYSNRVVVDRLSSTQMPGVDKQDSYDMPTSSLSHKMSVFLDRSMVEIVLDSSASLTTRVYPMYGDSDAFHFADNGGHIEVTSLRIVNMESVYYEATTPSYYPESSYLSNGGTLR